MKLGFLAACLLLLLATSLSCVYGKGLSFKYYDKSCPSAASIVKAGVMEATAADFTAPAPLLRLFFHDCFVRGGKSKHCGGCDASNLLNNTGSEQEAVPNLTLAGFDVIESIKADLEAACPGIVSCADVLALAARFAIVAAKGPDMPLPLGRRDSPANSRKANAERCLPSHDLNYTGLISNFKAVGLSPFDVITLSGAHTIGQSHCSNLQDRLYNAKGKKKLDHTLSGRYARRILYPNCPTPVKNPTTVDDIDAEGQVFMDPITNTKFDNAYYVALTQKTGLFTSDSQLFLDSRSKRTVESFAADQKAFFEGFAASLVRMGNIHTLTGKKGIVRKVCFKNP